MTAAAFISMALPLIVFLYKCRPRLTQQRGVKGETWPAGRTPR